MTQCLIAFVLCVSAMFANGQDITWNQAECREMMESCKLHNGIPGAPGARGREGPKGQPGAQGPVGPRGPSGPEGNPPRGSGGTPTKGLKGSRGDIGPRGPKGHPGPDGTPGDLGKLGKPGTKGQAGIAGDLGGLGPNGQKGEPGPELEQNWKQCTFTPDVNANNGELYSCSFSKSRDNTSLYIMYQGNTQLSLCGNCCKTWRFTFNRQDCTDPDTVNAAFSGLNLKRQDGNNRLPDFVHGSFSGYCKDIPRGLVRVGLRIDDCHGFLGRQVSIPTSINTTSRIIIQELPPPQS